MAMGTAMAAATVTITVWAMATGTAYMERRYGGKNCSGFVNKMQAERVFRQGLETIYLNPGYLSNISAGNLFEKFT